MKAVIMAGGEGSRLRPLTCTLPKPMARLLGRPVLEYGLDLLAAHGVDTAYIAVRYMKEEIVDHFPSQQYRGVRMIFSEETEPLGTAGSVKLAAGKEEECVLVLSGDALTDIDLSAAYRRHQTSGADATIVVSRVRDPREYGLVSVGPDGFVAGFIEKPGWTQATTDAANTGIYLLNPSCLTLIPEKKNFDFAADLFPLMLAKGRRIAVYDTPGYWCDIGDMATYLSCQQDMLAGLVKLSPSALGGFSGVDGVTLRGAPPQGDYKLVPPVYIGERVRIGRGAVVGPGAVLDDGAAVGEMAKVRGSVLLPGAYLAERARATGAVVCAGASAGQGSSLFEGSVLGAGAKLGASASLMPGVRVWPGKAVPEGDTLYDNLQHGFPRPDFFDDDGISGEAGIEVTPEFCARLGSAVGSMKNGSRIGVALGGADVAAALASAFIAGAVSTGAQVWNFGRMMESQASFAGDFCSLPLTAYIYGGARCFLKLFGEGGLPATRPLERELEAKLTRGEFARCAWSEYREAADMSGMTAIYQQELYRLAPGGVGGAQARVRCGVPAGERLLADTLARLGCDVRSGPIFSLSSDGMSLSVTHDELGFLPPERVLCLCCLEELELGRDLALPFAAPAILDELAVRYGQKVRRFLSYPADGSDAPARLAARAQRFAQDGMMQAVKLLAFLARTGRTLTELDVRLPAFATAHRELKIELSPAEVLSSLKESGLGRGEGVTLIREEGRVFVRPNKRGRAIALLAEARTGEIAAELCAQVGRELMESMHTRSKTEGENR